MVYEYMYMCIYTPITPPAFIHGYIYMYKKEDGNDKLCQALLIGQII